MPRVLQTFANPPGEQCDIMSERDQFLSQPMDDRSVPPSVWGELLRSMGDLRRSTSNRADDLRGFDGRSVPLRPSPGGVLAHYIAGARSGMQPFWWPCWPLSAAP